MKTDKIFIVEGLNVQAEWYESAKKQTTETLSKYINHLMDDYEHDYGTLCHAIAAGAIAAASAMDNHENGGISGFQAGAVMWGFINHWMFPFNKTGLQLVDYDNMLYPQYEHRFEKHISSSTWHKIQDVAAQNLNGDLECVNSEVIEHWKSIVEGNIPFGYTVSDED